MNLGNNLKDNLKNTIKLVDSHCHLDRCDLKTLGFESIDQCLIETRKNHIVHLLCVCVDLPNFKAVRDLAEQYPDMIHCSVGAHPADPHDPEPSEQELIQLASDDLVLAIGETGLDYFHCKGDITWQQNRFKTHIRAAKSVNKPLIIHTRDAQEDTLKFLKSEGADQVGGVMHCFTESWEFAKSCMDLGFYISFSGIVTFKNAKDLQEVAKKVPIDKLLIETDAPYLTPVPYRGKPNQPAYVRHVAEFLAELRGESLLDLAERTTQNFCDLFKVKI